MQLKQFIDESYSFGKGSVKFPIGGLLEQYHTRYEQLRKEYRNFNFTVWYVQPGGRTVVHFKVPSETVHGFFYDVLIELNMSGGATKFEDCHVKFFSNCPSFVFTYANIFYTMKDPETGSDSMIIDKFNQKIPKDRLMVKGAEKKLDDLALTEKPVVRNPLGIALPDKSIYYAIFYLLDVLDFRKTMYSRHSTSMARLLQTVSDFDVLMSRRDAEDRKQRDRNREAKRELTKTMRTRERELNTHSTDVQRVKPIKKMESTNTHKMTPIKSQKRRK